MAIQRRTTVAGAPLQESRHHWFRNVATRSAAMMGDSRAFLIAVGLIVLWLAAGPYYRYSDTWELVVNTGTSIITFLMVVLIQNTQNRDVQAIQLKLDELIRAVEGARTGLVKLEQLTDEELEALQREFQRLHTRKAVIEQASS